MDARAVAAAYRRLCVPPGAPWPTIKAAYRHELLRAHPDHGGTAALTHQLVEAYTLLKDTYSAEPVADQLVLRPRHDLHADLVNALSAVGTVTANTADHLVVDLRDRVSPHRLSVHIEARGGDRVVSFTLTSPDAEQAPSLPRVVALVAGLL